MLVKNTMQIGDDTLTRQEVHKFPEYLIVIQSFFEVHLVISTSHDRPSTTRYIPLLVTMNTQ